MVRVIIVAISFWISAVATVMANEQNLLFILDGSGSMRGRVEGKPKISIAKDRFIRHILLTAGKTGRVSVDFSTTE